MEEHEGKSRERTTVSKKQLTGILAAFSKIHSDLICSSDSWPGWTNVNFTFQTLAGPELDPREYSKPLPVRLPRYWLLQKSQLRRQRKALAGLFPVDPLTNVRRALIKLDAARLAGGQETHGFPVNQFDLV